ncbi:MAG: hypothetical protein ACXACP_08420 [Candidatus Hodarchaeales archaeon]|jgi:amino acid transporter
MKGSEKMAVYVGTLLFIIIGYLVMLISQDALLDVINDIGIDFLTSLRVSALVSAIGWFILSFLVYWGSTKWLETGEKVGIISLFFIVLWLIAGFGVLLSSIIYDLLNDIPVTLDLDPLLDAFFIGLTIALIPTLAAALGVSNKSY